MATAGGRLQGAIRDAASAAVDSAAYRQRVLEAVNACVPFDAACLGGTDPVSLLPTSLTTVGYGLPGTYPTVFDIEYGAGKDEPTRYELLRSSPVPIRTLREATGGHVRGCRFYADVLRPSGLRDEVRMLFRGSDGHCWGALTIARARGEFADDEVAALGAVLTDVGDGLRAALFRDGSCKPRGLPEGPAITVIGPGDEVESATPAALDYLDRLGWGPPERSVAHSPVAAVSTWLRQSGQACVVLRARTRDGQWVVIRGGRFDGEHPPRRVVMTFEQAQLPQIASLTALAHRLTRRETEVLAHVLAGRSRDEIARVLFISPYTAQDHLKSIYAKTGVSSRRALLGMLVRTEYLPRLGSPVGADGWFAAAGQAGPPGVTSNDSAVATRSPAWNGNR